MRVAFLFVALIAGCSDGTVPSDATRDKPASAAPQVAQASAPYDRGRRLFDDHCAACHDAGPGHPGTIRLALRLGDAQAPLLARSDLARAVVEQIVRSGSQMMPPFRPTELADEELDAIAGYVAQHYAGE
jgi:mono/diheme cytochrome c family protein